MARPRTPAFRTEPGSRTRPLRVVLCLPLVVWLTMAPVQPAKAAVLSFSPVDDASLRSDLPDGNFGLGSRLTVDNTPKKDVLLKFSVFGVGTGTIGSASLLLYNVNASPLGGEVRRVDDHSWEEGTVTWNLAPPAADPTPLAVLGPVAAGTAYSVDLGGYVTGDGHYSLRISTPSGNNAAYMSDEAKTVAQRPLLQVTLDTGPPPPPPPADVVFAAAGDHGANGNTDAGLRALDGSGVNFYLALGDLDYDQTPTDEAWCEFVTSRLPTLGPGFPFELVSGNHEDQGGPDGYILNHAACLPDRLGATISPTGLYGSEYSFDYPAADPLLRVIMISPGLTIEGQAYDYSSGSARALWLEGTIDTARAAGIPWVVVGMHKACITAGVKSCDIGSDLLDLLVGKRVDLVLQAHDHNYQRSHQLAIDPAACPSILVGGFDHGCVADDGGDGTYPRGAGSVVVIGGTFGTRALYSVNPADPEAPYFARMNSDTRGFVRYSLTSDRFDARFVSTGGTFTDSFTIAAP